MKKYLPLILLGAGILLFVIVFFFVKSSKKDMPENLDDESTLVEVPLEKRPIVSLVPSEDGHYLKLKVEKIVVENVASLDYYFEYLPANGVAQGFSDVVTLDGAESIEKDILLGTESSGKFRYDEGVESGKIEIKYRNEGGKLLAKFETDFHLQSNTKELSSTDGNFKVTLENLPKNAFFVTMHTIGQTDSLRVMESQDGYAVFSSDESLYRQD